MNLPDNYVVENGVSNERWLYELAWVYRSVKIGADTVQAKCEVGPLAGKYVRSVASFRKGTKIRDIEEIARLDSMSRNPRMSEGARQNAFWELAARFST